MKKHTLIIIVTVILMGLPVLIFYLIPDELKHASPHLTVLDSLPPDTLWHSKNYPKVGYAVYNNPKSRKPLFAADVNIPMTKTTTWFTSSMFDGDYTMHFALWVKATDKLYLIAHGEKRYAVAPNKYVEAVETVSIDADRKISVTISVPDLNLHDKFGPFDLP